MIEYLFIAWMVYIVAGNLSGFGGSQKYDPKTGRWYWG